MTVLHFNELNHIADHNFDTAVEEAGDHLLVLDFMADWCEPCLAMGPSVEELATEFNTDVYVATIDLDHSPELTDRFKVMSIPLVLMLREGEVVKRLQGARSKAALKQEIDAVRPGH